MAKKTKDRTQEKNSSSQSLFWGTLASRILSWIFRQVRAFFSWVASLFTKKNEAPPRSVVLKPQVRSLSEADKRERDEQVAAARKILNEDLEYFALSYQERSDLEKLLIEVQPSSEDPASIETIKEAMSRLSQKTKECSDKIAPLKEVAPDLERAASLKKEAEALLSSQDLAYFESHLLRKKSQTLKDVWFCKEGPNKDINVFRDAIGDLRSWLEDIKAAKQKRLDAQRAAERQALGATGPVVPAEPSIPVFLTPRTPSLTALQQESESLCADFLKLGEEINSKLGSFAYWKTNMSMDEPAAQALEGLENQYNDLEAHFFDDSPEEDLSEKIEQQKDVIAQARDLLRELPKAQARIKEILPPSSPPPASAPSGVGAPSEGLPPYAFPLSPSHNTPAPVYPDVVEEQLRKSKWWEYRAAIVLKHIDPDVTKAMVHAVINMQTLVYSNDPSIKSEVDKMESYLKDVATGQTMNKEAITACAKLLRRAAKKLTKPTPLQEETTPPDYTEDLHKEKKLIWRSRAANIAKMKRDEGPYDAYKIETILSAVPKMERLIDYNDSEANHTVDTFATVISKQEQGEFVNEWVVYQLSSSLDKALERLAGPGTFVPTQPVRSWKEDGPADHHPTRKKNR